MGHQKTNSWNKKCAFSGHLLFCEFAVNMDDIFVEMNDFTRFFIGWGKLQNGTLFQCFLGMEMSFFEKYFDMRIFCRGPKGWWFTKLVLGFENLAELFVQSEITVARRYANFSFAPCWSSWYKFLFCSIFKKYRPDFSAAHATNHQIFSYVSSVLGVRFQLQKKKYWLPRSMLLGKSQTNGERNFGADRVFRFPQITARCPWNTVFSGL